MKPNAYTPDLTTTLWVMDDVVAVLNSKHAAVVFQHAFPGLKVYGIKDTTANLLLSYDQALEFFGDHNAS